MAIKIDQPKPEYGKNFYGVWENGRPRGRVRPTDGGFRAFTNLRAPGDAFLGTFKTLDEAAERVVAES